MKQSFEILKFCINIPHTLIEKEIKRKDYSSKVNFLCGENNIINEENFLTLYRRKGTVPRRVNI